MATFKMFTTSIIGKIRFTRYPVSLSGLNGMLNSAFLGTCDEIKFKTWEDVRQFIIKNFEFDDNNKAYISMHQLIEAKQKGLDPRPFTNSCITFRVYDL